MSEFEDQIRECYGRAIYTHKAHMKMADICAGRLNQLKLLQVVLTALTASGLLAILFSDEYWLKFCTAIVSFLSLYTSSYIKGFDPGGTAQKHIDTAARLWAEAVWKQADVVDFRRSGGGGHGGFH